MTNIQLLAELLLANLQSYYCYRKL